jgi:TatD DNase family protein
MDFLDEEILKETQSNKGVSQVITNSVNIKSLKKSLQLSKKYPKIKIAAGLYPEETLKEKDFQELKKIILSSPKKIIAIGEIGLDFSRPSPKKELQKKIFIKQLNLAKELNIPVIIHTRKAEKEVLEILEKYKDQKIILHCFSGNFKLIKKAEENNFYLTLPTNIIRSEHFQRIAKEYKKDLLLTETDSPCLSPFKEKQNQPAYIKETIKKLSKIWNKSQKEVENIIETNFKNIFRE